MGEGGRGMEEGGGGGGDEPIDFGKAGLSNCSSALTGEEASVRTLPFMEGIVSGPAMASKGAAIASCSAR